MTELKYNLKNRVKALSKAERYQLLMNLNRTEKTLIEWCKIPLDSHKSISVDCLYYLASYFKCTPDELVNNGKNSN